MRVLHEYCGQMSCIPFMINRADTLYSDAVSKDKSSLKENGETFH